jgi:hypothetical protein
MDIDLRSDEWGTLLLLLLKCELLNDAVQAGLPVTLTKDNFKFPDGFSDKSAVRSIAQKIYHNESLAWLKEQRGAYMDPPKVK